MNRVPASLEIHRLFRPQPAQEVDLLFATPTAGVEILAKGLVLRRASPNANAKPNPPAAHGVQGR